MKTYTYNGTLEDFITAVNGEITDAIEGTLIDDVFIESDSKNYCLFETYKTAWSSCYTVHESETKEERDELFTLWYERQDEREKQAQEIEGEYRRLYGGAK